MLAGAEKSGLRVAGDTGAMVLVVDPLLPYQSRSGIEIMAPPIKVFDETCYFHATKLGDIKYFQNLMKNSDATTVNINLMLVDSHAVHSLFNINPLSLTPSTSIS